MLNFLFYLLVAAAVLSVQTEAKQFTKCELVQELRWQGFPEDLMRDWVCLVEAESERHTDVLGGPNSNGSIDWGLFQINDNYWCDNPDNPGLSNECGISCSQLITDDITVASECAKKIFDRHHFSAWHGWTKKCQDTLPDISDC